MAEPPPVGGREAPDAACASGRCPLFPKSGRPAVSGWALDAALRRVNLSRAELAAAFPARLRAADGSLRLDGLRELALLAPLPERVALRKRRPGRQRVGPLDA